MIKECIILMIERKEIPYYYFKFLYRKHVTNYRDYLSAKQIIAIRASKKLHNPEYLHILDNKLAFSLFIEHFDINSPKLLSFNLASNFVTDNKVHSISNQEELRDYLNLIFNKTGSLELFFRPFSSNGGKGCFKLNSNNIDSELDKVFDIVINENYLCTEVLKQHEKLNQIFAKSINTIRLLSLITSDNEVEVLSACMRFGVGDNFVDNASSGGFFVGINLEDGTLKKTGHYLPEQGGMEITKHPDTGFVFEGFKIPYFKEACALAVKAVNIIPDRFIGWDIAITPQGPTIIESNVRPYLYVSDVGHGGLLKNKFLREVVSDPEFMT